MKLCGGSGGIAPPFLTSAQDSYVVTQTLNLNCNKGSPMCCVNFGNQQFSSEHTPRLPKSLIARVCNTAEPLLSSLSPSVCMQETTREPLVGFKLNLTAELKNLRRIVEPL
jgi:hypothetical protein